MAVPPTAATIKNHISINLKLTSNGPRHKEQLCVNAYSDVKHYVSIDMSRK